MDLQNRTALITGASSGIGREIAFQLADLGCSLILGGRRRERLLLMEAELKDRFDVDCHLLDVDLRDREMLLRALGEIPSELRPVSLLVNNAGLALGLGSLCDSSAEEWETVLDTNLRASLCLCRQLIPPMVRQGFGHVVNIGSIAGRQPYRGGAVYCASKAALLSLTRTLQIELADTPVRVTTIDPGMVETEFSQVRFGGDEKAASAVYENMTPLTPEDIAESVRWALTRPAHVQVAEMVLFPTCQGSAHTIHRGDFRK